MRASRRVLLDKADRMSAASAPARIKGSAPMESRPMDLQGQKVWTVQRASVWSCCLLASVLGCLACADDEAGSDDESVSQGDASAADVDAAAAVDAGGPDESNQVDVAALKATGLDKYLGAAKPSKTEDVGGETHYTFDEADGPVCLRGVPFSMATRARDSEDLMIYLQGGGSCTTALCRATEMANPTIPGYGVLNANDPENPFADWNVVYSPYCDGSLHFGDSDIPDMNRKHHGLRNVSASLDVAATQFPKPERVFLTGASAGGYGTIWVTALVRLIYPDAKLYVFNDAGIAISNPASPDGFRSVLGEWGADKFIPETCEDCRSMPHLTPWMSWNLKHDRGMKLTMFSAYEDSVIAGTFLMLEPSIFKDALVTQTAAVVATAPERAKRFLVNGTQHTVRDIHMTAVDGLSVGQWLQQMLDDDPAWDNVLQ